jgi:hypothetical protein
VQDGEEVHDFGEGGDLAFFEIGLSVNEALLLHLVKDPAVCGDGGHAHTHPLAVVGRLSVLVGAAAGIYGLF